MLRTLAPFRRIITRRSFFVELERDVVVPRVYADYVSSVAAHASTRRGLDPGYLASFGVDVGHKSSIYHLSTFADYDARDARERLADLRAYNLTVETFETSVFAEATATLEAAGLLRGRLPQASSPAVGQCLTQ